MQPIKSFLDRMDRARKAHLAPEKRVDARRRTAQRGAPRAALGQGRQALSVDAAVGQEDAGRLFEGKNSSCAAFHVRPDWNEGCKSAHFFWGGWAEASSA